VCVFCVCVLCVCFVCVFCACFVCFSCFFGCFSVCFNVCSSCVQLRFSDVLLCLFSVCFHGVVVVKKKGFILSFSQNKEFPRSGR